eukprot:CAMPEP_0169166966 /NCGR_PEP_ID=MMETSP1015-20121227/60220_1 /TAXON_ID=342587 /ORGANISM="Karlodinium micrum, Strain CCMP2283" /LENGTH=271 /DNA_ID=CAMNT_0009239645 /DNA_START=68 /DNA_END=883 /DNA_ORIENTATION=+
MIAPTFELLRRQSKGCSTTKSRIDDDVSIPTEELVDSALGKSAQLIGELAKLGITVDAEDLSDGVSTCSGGLPSSASAKYSSSDAEDESGCETPLHRSSLSSLAIVTNEHQVAKLLALREKVHKLKECMGQDDSSIIKQSSEAIFRLEAHLQGLTSAADATQNAHFAHTDARLQKLEAVVGQLKKRRSLCPAARSTIAARSPSPASRALPIVPHARRATSPMQSPFMPTRNLSPARTTSRRSLPGIGAKPKRVVCQQVAVTQVYNVWSTHD